MLRARHKFGAVLFLAASLALGVACGSAETKPKTHTVAIRGFQYAPPTLTVRVGDTVVWKNADVVPHTATAKGKGLDTGAIAANGSGQYVAKKKGTYAYDCTFHPTMRGTLVVQ